MHSASLLTLLGLELLQWIIRPKGLTEISKPRRAEPGLGRKLKTIVRA